MSQDDTGFPLEIGRKETEVMAEVRDARRSEYYQSVHAGMEVKLEVKVNIDDYEAAVMETGGRKVRPTLAVYDGDIYKIIRAWQKGRKKELSLQEVE